MVSEALLLQREDTWEMVTAFIEQNREEKAVGKEIDPLWRREGDCGTRSIWSQNL